jgi:hypothetical protein
MAYDNDVTRSAQPERGTGRADHGLAGRDPLQKAADAATELEQLRRDFPRYAIGVVTSWDHSRYLAQRRRPGPGPHTVLTDDLTELRAELSQGHGDPAVL